MAARKKRLSSKEQAEAELDAAVMKIIADQLSVVSQSATNSTASVEELMAILKALEEMTERKPVKDFVICEEPEFVWEGGSNLGPQAPRPLHPR